jgi:hypothetical protein
MNLSIEYESPPIDSLPIDDDEEEDDEEEVSMRLKKIFFSDDETRAKV